MIGRTIGHYEVLKEIGAGGMGVVYQARDVELGRLVAIKVLPLSSLGDEDHKRRLLNEARVASALNHPNIATIYEISHDGDTDCIVMEYVEGRPLSDLIPKDGFSIKQAVDYGIQVAGALAAAHAAGITHRDVKPANILITAAGVAKVVDFGLAKYEEKPVGPEEATRISGGTQPGLIVGTPFYMSPEQAEGKVVDARSDVFSLGIVLYEMMSGRKPFQGDSQIRTLMAIIGEPAAPIQVPRELAAILASALEKDREKRPGAADIAHALGEYQLSTASGTDRSAMVAPRYRRGPAIAIACAVLAAVGLGVAWRTTLGPAPRARRSIGEVARLMSAGESFEAVLLAHKIQPYVADDPEFRRIWSDITRLVNVDSDPPDAKIYYKAYGSPESDWRLAGRTPLENLAVPASWKFLIKAEKDGYETAYGGAFKRGLVAIKRGSVGRPSVLHFALDPRGSNPPGMVAVPAPVTPGLSTNGLPPLGSLAGGFYIDRDEVTNAAYKRFVDAGGYQKEEFWKQPFMKDGHSLSWSEAMREFQDRSGRPGPATWEAGSFLGRADDPVGGVSWYEAAAYAEFAGKKLPALAHWIRAGFSDIEFTAVGSNFAGTGPAPAGKFPSVGLFGTRDMAGNVKEWCWNANESGLRFILGGDWTDPMHQATKLRVLSPFDRSPGNGFRCIRPRGALDPVALAPKAVGINQVPKPVSDEVFQAYRSEFAYDPPDLDVKLERPAEDAEDWKVEKVSFSAAYANARVAAYVYLPKTGRPPYQTIVYFPPQFAEYMEVFSANIGAFNYLLRSGRAVVFPVYEGTFERMREFSPAPRTALLMKELIVRRIQDAQRAVDYIASRSDLDHDHVGFLGTSLGAAYGPALLAVEPRFHAAVLHDGGLVVLQSLLSAPLLPEVNQAPFAARVKVPVLMINGLFDNIFPQDIAQKPMFELLGARSTEKRYVQLNAGHGVLYDDRPRVVRETLDWFDKYLGPVPR